MHVSSSRLVPLGLVLVLGIAALPPPTLACSGDCGIVGVAARWDHSLARRADGVGLAFGFNSRGQLGNGTMTDSPWPETIRRLNDQGRTVTKLAAGQDFSLALLDDGTVWAWGSNMFGQLGDGLTAWSTDAVQVLPVGRFVDIAAGHTHALGVLDNGTVFAWGNNDHGQCGRNPLTNPYLLIPTSVPGLPPCSKVGAGTEHSLAITITGGFVWNWGDGDEWQLGQGGTIPTSSYVPLQPLDSTSSRFVSNVVEVAGGWTHSLALKATGKIVAWGNNDHGQIGNPAIATFATTAVAVKFPKAAPLMLHLASGYRHSLSIDTAGRMWAWGWNYRGQLCTGATGPELGGERSPVQSLVVDAVAIAGGGAHSLAALDDGSARSCGFDGGGQLGDGAITPAASPSPVTVQAGTGVDPIPPGGQDSAMTCSVQVLGLGQWKAIVDWSSHPQPASFWRVYYDPHTDPPQPPATRCTTLLVPCTSSTHLEMPQGQCEANGYNPWCIKGLSPCTQAEGP
jgi:alpha-tubulin suppressor-like RCC1 family protein